MLGSTNLVEQLMYVTICLCMVVNNNEKNYSQNVRSDAAITKRPPILDMLFIK